jgi:hypothetical protein
LQRLLELGYGVLRDKEFYLHGYNLICRRSHTHKIYHELPASPLQLQNIWREETCGVAMAVFMRAPAATEQKSSLNTYVNANKYANASALGFK